MICKIKELSDHQAGGASATQCSLGTISRIRRKGYSAALQFLHRPFSVVPARSLRKSYDFRNDSGGMLDRDVCHEMSVSDRQGVKRKTSSVGFCIVMPASQVFFVV
jgi:hypothetical protein